MRGRGGDLARYSVTAWVSIDFGRYVQQQPMGRDMYAQVLTHMYIPLIICFILGR